MAYKRPEYFSITKEERNIIIDQLEVEDISSEDSSRDTTWIEAKFGVIDKNKVLEPFDKSTKELLISDIKRGFSSMNMLSNIDSIYDYIFKGTLDTSG